MKRTTINKSAFVRTFAEGTPAKDVVAAGKKKGIKLSERYVYVIRSSDKAKARRRGLVATGGRGPRKAVRTEEAALRSAIVMIGLARTREIVAELERAVG